MATEDVQPCVAFWQTICYLLQLISGKSFHPCVAKCPCPCVATEDVQPCVAFLQTIHYLIKLISGKSVHPCVTECP